MAAHWHELLDVPADVLEKVPRGYDLIGDVVIVRLPEGTEAYRTEIGRALVEGVPPARTAAVDAGVEGEIRTRDVQVIGGEGQLVTEHKENGCRLIVDIQRTYFSPRLAHERDRVASQLAGGEHVLDMYCGVGPYAVLMAKRDARVVAIDVNPAATRLAYRNAARNKVQDAVDVVLADAGALVPALEASFDRVVMNLPHSAQENLGEALSVLAPGGRVHLGAMLAKDDAEDEAQAIAEAHELTLAELVHVRNYNPAVGHYTLDLDRPENG